MLRTGPNSAGPPGRGIYAGKNLPIEWSTDQERRLEEADPRQRLVVPDRAGGPDLSDHAPCRSRTARICRSRRSASTRPTASSSGQTEVFRQDGAKAPQIHSKNSHASPTPITDGKRLYVHFGHQGTACLDLDGKVLWRNTDLQIRTGPRQRRHAHPRRRPPRLLRRRRRQAIRLRPRHSADGKIAWKTDRKSEAAQKFSFSTPLLINVNGKPQIVSPASDAVIGLRSHRRQGNLARQIHRLFRHPAPRLRPRHGLSSAPATTRPACSAIKRRTATGDVTKSHVAWNTDQGRPAHAVAAPGRRRTLHGLRQRPGQLPRRPHRQGPLAEPRATATYSASPFYADGKIYLQSEPASPPLSAGKTFEILATQQIERTHFRLLRRRRRGHLSAHREASCIEYRRSEYKYIREGPLRTRSDNLILVSPS